MFQEGLDWHGVVVGLRLVVGVDVRRESAGRVVVFFGLNRHVSFHSAWRSQYSTLYRTTILTSSCRESGLPRIAILSLRRSGRLS